MSQRRNHEGFSPSSRIVGFESDLWGKVSSMRKKTKSPRPQELRVVQDLQVEVAQAAIQEEVRFSIDQEEKLIVDLSSPLVKSGHNKIEANPLHPRIYKSIQDGTMSKRGKPNGKDYEEELRAVNSIVDFGLHARNRIKGNLHLGHGQIAS